MPTTEVCHAGWMINGMPFLAVGIVLFVLTMRTISWRIWRARRTGPVRPAFWVLFVVVAFGIGVWLRAENNESFHAFEVVGGELRLHYLWPKETKVLAPSAIESFGVVRGRSFGKRNKESDKWWLRVSSGGVVQTSCQSGLQTEIAGYGKAIASALGKALEWRVRCPHGDLPVVTTEALVTAPGNLDVAAACGEAPSR